MLVPAEAQALADPPMGRLRGLADAELDTDIVDVSLFPVQPWLDVPDLGFGVTVTSWGNPVGAQAVADRVAQAAWEARSSFAVQVHPVDEVVTALRPRPAGGPVLLVQSADSPTAGADRGQRRRHRRPADRPHRHPQLRHPGRCTRGGGLPCSGGGHQGGGGTRCDP